MFMLIIVNLYQKLISKHCLLLIALIFFISKFLLRPKSVLRYISYCEPNIMMCIVSSGNCIVAALVLIQLLKFYDNFIVQYHTPTVQFSNINDADMIYQWYIMPHWISSFEIIFATSTISVHVKYPQLTNNIIHHQRSSRMKKLLFRKNFSKSQTLDTERHFLNGFQRPLLPF